jgi:DNA polymerase III subunit alpha
MAASVNTLLNVRTHFSLGESVMQPDNIVQAAQDLGLSRIAICDTMSISGLVEVSKPAKEAGIAVHCGVRLRIVAEAFLNEKKSRDETFYVKVFPKSFAGLQSIMRLLSRANEPDRFYYHAQLTAQDVIQWALTSPDVVFTTGDAETPFTHRDGPAFLDHLVEVAPVFAELCPVQTAYFDRLNIEATRWGRRVNARFLVTMPTFYPKGEQTAYKINMAIQSRGNLRNGNTVSESPFDGFWAHTEAELRERVYDTLLRLDKRGGGDSLAWDDGVENTKIFLDHASYVWEKQPISLPVLAPDANAALQSAAVAGMKSRLARPTFGHTPTPTEVRDHYIPRLKYELQVLKDLDFATYFLLVANLVGWAKSQGIMVGPGRGSVGGSLVAYAIGITDVDPIRFGLLFERFINPSRNDLPDADLDFMSTRRNEVVAYLEETYGTEHVAGISNYGALGAASAIRDVGRVHGLEMKDTDAAKLVPKVHGMSVDLEEAAKEVADIAIFRDRHPNIWKTACALQGVMRSYGRHAAGVVVSGVPLVDRAVVERRSEDRVINWDKQVAEDMGLVKLDVLGLSTLDTISRALDFIEQRSGVRPDIMAIPLDDPKTMEGFSAGQTVGVFQFEGGAARRILKDMAVGGLLRFDDLVAANALNRPGPVDAGLVEDYIHGRSGRSTVPLAHPAMAEALKDTFNVIVYQEQVMRVAVDLCGFTLADADGLRKAMGKKSKALMAKYKEQFIEGAHSINGMDKHAATLLFEQIEVFAGYAFNKSHAAEYSLISYQAMWLKTHYPLEFYAAAFSTVDEDKLGPLLRDAQKVGIKVMPPDVNASTEDFVIEGTDTLRIPFNRLKGIQQKTTDAIIAARAAGPFTSKADFEKRIQDGGFKRFCNVRHIDTLDQVGAFASIEPGTPPADSQDRLRAQIVLMPGLVSAVVKATRKLPTDKITMAKLSKIQDAVNAVDVHVVHPRPHMGKRAKFLVVQDCPTWAEEQEFHITGGKTFEQTSQALYANGLSREHAYWTTLVRRVKEAKVISPDEIKAYQHFLAEEIDILKPPVIVTLGSASARAFLPDLKGSIMDHAGRTVFSPKLDAMIVIGFNPQMCHFDADKLPLLQEVFRKVTEIIEI